jgi:GntR family negative regulator for fad regulon and positive regulator of fabA
MSMNQLSVWQSPAKPAEYAESRLIEAILQGHFAIDSNLPAERELAAQLGVTRPTLREALQRLARDGWIEIRHGRPTRIRNYWQEGNLGVLGAIARDPEHLPGDFIEQLLSVRLLLAPTYTRLAVEQAPATIENLLVDYLDLPDTPQDYASADWKLQHTLCVASGNPIFTLILNGFHDLYKIVGNVYFHFHESRARSKSYYFDLKDATLCRDHLAAEKITVSVMQESIRLWRMASSQT